MRYKLSSVERVALPQVEILVGLLTVPAARSIRDKRRRLWLNKTQYDCPIAFDYRFILSIRDSFDGRLLNEAQQQEDLLFVDAPAGFDYISYKVKLFVDWAVDNCEDRHHVGRPCP